MWDQSAYHKSWRAKNRDKLKANTIKYRYGITAEEYEDLMLKANSCNICGNAFTGPKDKHVDHCHETKKVRGVLCTKCNLGIGLLMHNKEVLYSAIDYLLSYEIQSKQEVSP